MRINEPAGGAVGAVKMHRKSSLVQNNLGVGNRRCSSVVFNITIPSDEGATDDQTKIIEWYVRYMAYNYIINKT